MGLIGGKDRGIGVPSPADLLEINNIDTGVDKRIYLPILQEQTSLAEEDLDRILDQALRRGAETGWEIWREAHPEDSKTLAILIQKMIGAEDPRDAPLLKSLMGPRAPSEWSFHFYNPGAARLYISRDVFRSLEEAMVQGISDEIPMSDHLRRTIQRIYLRTDCNRVYWNKYQDGTVRVSLVLRFFMDVYPYDSTSSGLSLGWIEYTNKGWTRGSGLYFG